MKDSLIFENDELVYYKDGHPHHAGVIKVDGDIYYIGSKGRAVKGMHIVHRDMSNGILQRGTYTFGEDYKLVEGSYIAPKEDKHHKHRSHRSHSGNHHRSGKHRHSKKDLHFSWKKLWIPCTCVALVLVIGVALYHLEHRLLPDTDTPSGDSESTPTAKIILPDLSKDILLCSQAAKLEYDGQLVLENAVSTGDPYRAFQFEYSLSVDSAVLMISESPDMTEPRLFELSGFAHSVAIDNLKTNTQYYYKVIVDEEEHQGSFRTADSTRFLSIPGLVNVRDIGGTVTLDEKTVKQGLLIRGVELDGLENAAYYIPNDRIAEVQNTFGFAYDLDLRSPTIYSGTYSSRLGVPHKFYGAPMYGGIFNENNRSSLRQIFADLAKPQNYPMYLHCTWGTDRTGTVVFLLQGILNVSEEDMLREYELTGYGNPGIVGNGNMDVVINGLQSYPGETLQEKIVSFLLTDIGVTQEEIDSIRDIFLTE